MLNRDLEVEPAIAADWDIDATGTAYTFHIHPGAKFHGGRSITAQDVKYSWERAADPATDSPTARTYLGDIVGVDEMLDGEADHISGLEVVDDLTLKVTIDSPKVYFIQKLTYPTAFIVDQQNVESGGDEWTKAPNGTGRFKLKAWEEDDLLVLERFEGHHLGAPKLKHIVFQLFAGVGIQMYEAGEIDITGVSGANIERALDPQNPLNQDLVQGVGMCTNYIFFNVDQPPFDDIKVRRAFAMAIDFGKIIEVASKGHADPASSILPPGIPGYLPGQFDVEYDPEAARELLEQSEYFASGLLSEPLLSYSGSSAFHWMWETNLGVDIVDVALIDSDDWFNRRDAGEFGFGVTGWCADYPDPQNFLEVLFHSESDENYLGYSNPEVDALLDEAASEPDHETRLALYTEAESLILEDWAAVPFVHSRSYTLVKPYVENYVDTPIGIQDYHLLEIDR
jgi:ABC-type transport system substrate-binding protein